MEEVWALVHPHLGQLKVHIVDMRAVRCCHCIFCSLLYLEALSSFCRDCICIENSEIREGKTFDHFLAKKNNRMTDKY